jgi:glycogen operon protein
VELCLYLAGGEQRVAMEREGDLWRACLPGDLSGTPYHYRAQGEWAPERGLWFDPAKALVDPYALELDRRFVWHETCATYGVDTADLSRARGCRARCRWCRAARRCSGLAG